MPHNPDMDRVYTLSNELLGYAAANSSEWMTAGAYIHCVAVTGICGGGDAEFRTMLAEEMQISVHDAIKELERLIKQITERMETQLNNDPVNHPSHYVLGGIEQIDYVRSRLTHEQFIGYLLGTAMCYQGRCNHKGTFVQDIMKAGVYQRWLEDTVDPQPVPDTEEEENTNARR